MWELRGSRTASVQDTCERYQRCQQAESSVDAFMSMLLLSRKLKLQKYFMLCKLFRLLQFEVLSIFVSCCWCSVSINVSLFYEISATQGTNQCVRLQVATQDVIQSGSVNVGPAPNIGGHGRPLSRDWRLWLLWCCCCCWCCRNARRLWCSTTASWIAAATATWRKSCPKHCWRWRKTPESSCVLNEPPSSVFSTTPNSKSITDSY